MSCWPCCPEEDELSLTSFKRPPQAIKEGTAEESFLEIDAQESSSEDQEDVLERITRCARPQAARLMAYLLSSELRSVERGAEQAEQAVMKHMCHPEQDRDG